MVSFERSLACWEGRAFLVDFLVGVAEEEEDCCWALVVEVAFVDLEDVAAGLALPDDDGVDDADGAVAGVLAGVGAFLAKKENKLFCLLGGLFLDFAMVDCFVGVTFFGLRRINRIMAGSMARCRREDLKNMK